MVFESVSRDESRETKTIESVLESHRTRALCAFELLIVQIRLETTELRVTKCKSPLSEGGSWPAARRHAATWATISALAAQGKRFVYFDASTWRPSPCLYIDRRRDLPLTFASFRARARFFFFFLFVFFLLSSPPRGPLAVRAATVRDIRRRFTRRARAVVDAAPPGMLTARARRAV